MRAHVAREAPLEACGLLAGSEGLSASVFPIRNEEASLTHFLMDAKQQVQAFMAMERAGCHLLAIYHSHPAGPPRPSRTDLAEVTYPGVVQLIWAQAGGWDCFAFLLDEGQVQPLKYQLLSE